MRTTRFVLLASVFVGLALQGCTCDGGGGECTAPRVRITAPENGSQITADLDEDAARAGLQVTVTADVDTCVAEGSSATLVVNDDANLALSATVSGHEVTFPAVTLVKADSQGNLSVTVSVRDSKTGLVAKDVVGLRLVDAPDFPCVFSQPVGGSILGPSDDADPDTRGFQHDVVLTCEQDLTGSPANLTVDGVPVPSAIFAGDTATFPGLSFSEGVNTLIGSVTAAAGSWHGQIRVTVDTPDCEVRLEPAGETVFNVAGDPPRLEGRTAVADADSDPSNGIQAVFTASTPDCQGGEAVLIVDGEDRLTQAVDATSLTFDAIDLPDGDDVQIWAEVRSAGPDTPTGASITGSYWVDSVTPAPAVIFPASGAVLTAADDADQNPDNGLSADLVLEIPGLEPGALIAATISTASGTDTAVTCDLATDDCADPENPDRYLLPVEGLESPATYTLSVEVTDPAGNVGGVEPFEFTVDMRPRTVAIAAPEEGGVVGVDTPAPGEGLVAVTLATENLSEGASAVVTCSGAAGPATAALDASGAATAEVDFSGAPCEGLETTCTASIDDAGKTYESDPVTFRVDLSAPTVTIVSPEDGASVHDVPVPVEVITGCLEDGQLVRVRADDGTPASAAVTGDAAIVLLDVASGAHALTATAADAAGNETTSAAVNVVVDAEPPVVSFADPADGTIWTDANDASASEPGVQHDVTVQVANKPAGTQVVLQIGVASGATTVWGAPIGPELTAGATPAATFAGVTFPEGVFSLRAVATTGSGLRGEGVIGVTVDTGRTVCNIVSPADGASLGTAADANGDLTDGVQHDVRVATDAADGEAVQLTLEDGAGASHTYDAQAASGEAVFADVAFAAAQDSAFGRNTLGATCGAAGTGQGAALPAVVDVDLEAPVATIGSPADGEVFNAASAGWGPSSHT